MNEQTLHVNLGDRSYDILVGSDSTAQIGAFARQRTKGTTAFIVTDDNAQVHAEKAQHSLDAAGFRTLITSRRPGETQKSLQAAEQLYGILVDMPADRRTIVVAV